MKQKISIIKIGLLGFIILFGGCASNQQSLAPGGAMGAGYGGQPSNNTVYRPSPGLVPAPSYPIATKPPYTIHKDPRDLGKKQVPQIPAHPPVFGSPGKEKQNKKPGKPSFKYPPVEAPKQVHPPEIPALEAPNIGNKPVYNVPRQPRIPNSPGRGRRHKKPTKSSQYVSIPLPAHKVIPTPVYKNVPPVPSSPSKGKNRHKKQKKSE